MCCKLVAVVLLVAPSPKVQNRLVIEPAELSVNVTVNGGVPLVGVPLNIAVGGETVPRTLRPSVMNSTGRTKVTVPLPGVSDAIVLDNANMSMRFNAFTFTAMLETSPAAIGA